jgi:hypothetical protein
VNALHLHGFAGRAAHQTRVTSGEGRGGGATGPCSFNGRNGSRRGPGGRRRRGCACGRCGR